MDPIRIGENQLTEFDNYTYLKKVLPYAGGMSYRNQPDDELTIKMIQALQKPGISWMVWH